MNLLANLSSGLESVVQLLVALIVFVIVIVLTGLTTKWIGGYQKNRFSNKNLQPIESMKVGNNKFIQLVKVGEVYLVLGIGKDEVNAIAKLTKEELPDVIRDNTDTTGGMTDNFHDILAKLRNRNSREHEEEK